MPSKDASPGDPARPRGRMRRLVSPSILVLVSLAAAALIIRASGFGSHLAYDSFIYLGAASNLAKGHGLTYPFGTPGAPVTFVPPAFPLLLSIGFRVGHDPLRWALWQIGTLFGVLSLVAGFGTFWNTRRNLGLALAAQALTGLGSATLTVYSHILSESLFYPAELAALFLLGAFLRGRRPVHLVLAGVATSLGLLTRYAGLSVFLTGVLLLGVWPRRAIWERVKVLAIYSATSLALSGAWAIRNFTSTHTLTGARNLVSPFRWRHVLNVSGVLREWFLGEPFKAGWSVLEIVALGALGALIANVLLRSLRRTKDRPHLPETAVVMLVFPLVHFGFMIAANVFSSRTPPLNSRLLSPAYLSLVIAALLCGIAAWSAVRRRRAAFRAILAAGLVALLALVAARTPSLVHQHLSLKPQSSEALAGLGRQIQTQLGGTSSGNVYSNASNVLWGATGISAIDLPAPCYSLQWLPTPTYATDLAQLGDRLKTSSVTIVVFTGATGFGFGARACPRFSMVELEQVLKVVVIGRLQGIAILSNSAPHA